MRMEDSRAATAAGPRAARRRPQWLLPGALLLILVLLTINVLGHGPLLGADARIRTIVQAQANSAMWRWLSDHSYSPAQLLVDLGYVEVAVPILAVCTLVAMIRRRSLRPLLAAFAAVLLLLGTVIPAKILIGRAGPGYTTVSPGGLGVFPSGHTATSSVCLGVGVAVLLPLLSAQAGRVAVAVVAAVCLLVGVALVWCDYHWFTDVVAGWALAGLIIQGSLLVSRWPLPPWARGRE